MDIEYTNDKEAKVTFNHTFKNERVTAKISLQKLDKENAPVSSYNNANVSVEELKQQLLKDTDFIQQIKKSVVIEEDAGKVIEEEQSDGLDMDEGMLMAGLSMFENG